MTSFDRTPLSANRSLHVKVPVSGKHVTEFRSNFAFFVPMQFLNLSPISRHHVCWLPPWNRQRAMFIY